MSEKEDKTNLISTAIERVEDLNEDERKQMEVIGYLVINLINSVINEMKEKKQ